MRAFREFSHEIIQKILNRLGDTDISSIGDGTVTGGLSAIHGNTNGHAQNKKNPHGVTKAQVGLGNVDNTADANKSVASAKTADSATTSGSANTALKLTNTSTMKVDLASTDGATFTGEGGDVTLGVSGTLPVTRGGTGGTSASSARSKLGLGNVNNTSDADKPVSTAQATAIADAKSAGTTAQTNLATHTADKSNPHGVTKSQVGLGNVPNVATNDQAPTYSATTTFATLTSGEKLSVAFPKIKLAITNLIDHIANTSNPHSVTKSQVGLGSVPNVSTNNQKPTYTEATTLASLVSGETLSVSMGKIMKAITDLISHIANKSNPHGVTASQVGALTSADVLDSNTSTSKTNPLSANQGKVIYDKLVTLDAATVKTANVVNNLTSTSTTNPLSANQGKVLKGLIDNKNIVHSANKAYYLTVQDDSNLVLYKASDDSAIWDINVTKTTADKVSALETKVSANTSSIQTNASSISTVKTRLNGLAIMNKQGPVTFANGLGTWQLSISDKPAKYSQLQGVIVNGFGTGYMFVASITDASVSSMQVPIRCVDNPSLSGNINLSLTLIFASNI